MKKLILLSLLSIPMMVCGQTATQPDTIYVETPGTLEDVVINNSLLPPGCGTVVIKGNINLDDLNYTLSCGGFIRNQGYSLLDFSQTKLVGDDIPAKNFEDLFFREVKLPMGIYFLRQSLFRNCRYLKKVNIPETVEKIESFAFTDTELEEVVLPSKLEKIEKDAFSDIKTLRRVYCKSKTVPQMIDWTYDKKKVHIFTGCNVDEITLYVPEGCMEVYRNSESFGMFKKIVEVKEGQWPTDVNNVEQNNKLRIDVKDGGIVLSTDANNILDHVQVIGMDGSKRWQGSVRGNVNINLPKGIYIVQNGKDAVKVMLR